MTDNKEIGSYGQKLAADFLKQRNYQLLEANYYCRGGEIDLIASFNQQLVFVEVKTRLSFKFGYPEEALNQQKKDKIFQTALHYLEAKEINHDNYRFDLITVLINSQTKTAKISHYKGVF